MRRPLLTILLAAGLFLLPTTAGDAAAQRPAAHGADAADPEVIILVRHAETAPDGTQDPPLSGAGRARAARLAALLADAGLTHVHTTAYHRTRSTAGAVAGRLGLEAAVYDPRAPEAFAERLRALPGRHLVVGHSNTTPALVRLLGGQAGPPIAEDEHGRVYVLVPGPSGVRTMLLRY